MLVTALMVALAPYVVVVVVPAKLLAVRYIFVG
jgi:hypothetical protein